MSLIEAFVLGAVQGLTEFLPISSSAHLVLVPEVLGWDQPDLSFIVLLHAATLVSLLMYFGRELLQTVKGMGSSPIYRRFALYLIAGTIPASVIGAAFEKQFEEQFGHPVQVAVQLAATGVLMVFAEWLARRNAANQAGAEGAAASEPAVKLDSVQDLTQKLSWGKSLGVGFAQALAIVPGISRSGATIGAGLLGGLSRAQAARFSFLLSIPILAGTSLNQVPDLAASRTGMAEMVAGFSSALVCGYLAIAGMIGYLQKRGLAPFAAYCLIVGPLLAVLLSYR